MAYQVGNDWFADDGTPLNDFPGGASGTVEQTPGGAPQPAAPPPPAGPPPPNVPAPGNDPNQIQGWYDKFLGRQANDDEIKSHLGNPGGLPAVQNLIANSPEADAYNKAHGLGKYAPANKEPGAKKNQAESNLFDSPLLQPWVVPFNRPEFSYKDFAPSVTFKPTTIDDLYKDPGYKARLDAQQRAMERGAAAKGTLLNGGTVQDEMQAGQDYASNEFGNVDARNHANYNTIYGAEKDVWSTNYQHSLTDWTTNYNKSLGEYQQAYNIFANNQANQFNRLAAVSGIGQTAAGQLGSTGLNYANLYGNTSMNSANAQGDFFTQGANANAAGRVGAANAWNNAFGNIGNNTMANLYKSSYTNL